MDINELELQGFYSNGELYVKVPRTFEGDIYAFCAAVAGITPLLISVEILDEDEN